MMVAPLTQVPALMDDVVALARGVHAQVAAGVARAREIHAEVADVETQARRMHAVANAMAAVMPRVLLAFLGVFFSPQVLGFFEDAQRHARRPFSLVPHCVPILDAAMHSATVAATRCDCDSSGFRRSGLDCVGVGEVRLIGCCGC